MRDCLQNEPDERPSAKDLVNRLAGSTNRPNSMLSRGSGSASGGHISGQLLADGRCACTFSTLVEVVAQQRVPPGSCVLSQLLAHDRYSGRFSVPRRVIARVGADYCWGVTSAANCRLAEGAQCLAGASQAMAQQCTIAPRTMARESPTLGEGMTYLRSV